MENYLQAIAEPSAWVATAATFFREYALTWYTSWKENVISWGQPLEWKVLVEGLRRNVTTKYPERHLVNNRLALAKGGDRAKPMDTVGNKPKLAGNKRKSSDGQSSGDMESRKKPFKGRKSNTGTTSTPVSYTHLRAHET